MTSDFKGATISYKTPLLGGAYGKVNLGFGGIAASRSLTAPPAVSLEAAIAAHKAGRLSAAQISYQALIAAGTCVQEASCYLGMLLCQCGLPDQAIDHLDRAVSLAPRTAFTLVNRGLCLVELGRERDAEADFRAALTVDSSSAPALLNLSVLLSRRGDLQEAMSLASSVEIGSPIYPAAQRLRGRCLFTLGDYRGAYQAYQAAIHMDPSLGGGAEQKASLFNLGGICLALRRLSEASQFLDTLLQLDPAYPHALGLSQAAKMAGCDWDGFEERVARLSHLVSRREPAVNPFSYLMLCDDPALLRLCAEVHASRYPSTVDLAYLRPPVGERIRLAYLSCDMHDHATAHLMAGLFAAHDRSRFEVFLFSYGPDDGSSVRRRIEASVEHFVCLDPSASDADFARTIAAAGIDVLVDLKGYTEGGRPGVFALRPAPLQVSYLGYPGTLGAEWMDVLIADRTVVPPQELPNYTERVEYLPRCYQVADGRESTILPLTSRSEHGLPDQGFVFCSFNNVSKIQPAAFDMWLDILWRVPGSVLWLQVNDASAQARLVQRARASGIDKRRIVFAPHLPQAQHLARLALADLCLDTAPYGAHTTTTDALWSGVPVLTLPGRSFQSRVAASILAQAGLSDLVVQDRASFVAKAISIATSSEAFRDLRHRVATVREGSMFDSKSFASDFEAVICRIHSRHLAEAA